MLLINRKLYKFSKQLFKLIPYLLRLNLISLLEVLTLQTFLTTPFFLNASKELDRLDEFLTFPVQELIPWQLSSIFRDYLFLIHDSLSSIVRFAVKVGEYFHYLHKWD